MSLLRHYFISDDLDDLEVFEEQLEEAGIASSQIHVLTHDDHEMEVKNHVHLHDVQSFMKRDIVHSTIVGATIGFIGFVLILGVANIAGWTNTPAGQMPFIFLAVAVMGFCTWSGGLMGIQEPNIHFRRFQKALNDGKYVFFTDLSLHEEEVLEEVLKAHPKLELAGTGSSPPAWIVIFQTKIPWFFKEVWP